MTSKELKDHVTDLLERAAPDGSRVLVSLNADGSIDGEILAPVPRGVKPENVIVEIQDNIVDMRQEFPKGTYQAFGIRFPPNASDTKQEKYPLEGGLYNSWSSYNSLDRRGTNTNGAVAVTIAQGLRSHYYRKAEEVVFRVHWNRFGDRPPKDKT